MSFLERLTGKKQTAPQERPPEVALAELNQGLQMRALEAYNETDPRRRAEKMADVVGYTARRSFEESHGGPQSNDPARMEKMERFFTDAADDAIALYEVLEGANAENPQGKEEEYGTITSKGIAELNRSYLSRLGELLPEPLEGEQVQELIDRATFTDAIKMASAQLGVAVPADLSIESIKESLQNAEVQETGKAKIGSLVLGDPLNAVETEALELAVRLPNVTWMASQLNRADWEGKTDRINFKIRTAFSPYDLLKEEMFSQKREGKAGEVGAVLAVAFEIWKDVMELKSAQ